MTLNPYQLAGHVANLEFWSSEVAHCLDVLDQYNSRFDRLSAAQRAYVSQHETIQFELDDEWGDTAKTPPRPRRVFDKDRSLARTELCEAYYQFIVRCHRAGLIDEPTARNELERHSLSIDRRDL